MLDREMVIPSIAIAGQVSIEKLDAFGVLEKGSDTLEPLQKGAQLLLGRRVRHLASGKTGLVKFASHAGGRTIAVEFPDAIGMYSVDELEVVTS